LTAKSAKKGREGRKEKDSDEFSLSVEDLSELKAESISPMAFFFLLR